MPRSRSITNPDEDDLSERILGVLARMHPRRPTRAELLGEIKSQLDIEEGEGSLSPTRRIGQLIRRNRIEERLSLGEMGSPTDELSVALIGVSVDIATLQTTGTSQYDIIEEILQRTRTFAPSRFRSSSIPPLIVRDVSIVHGTDQFDILVTVIHTGERIRIQVANRENYEAILTYYVREVIQRIEGVSGTRSMIVASSKAYPTSPPIAKD
jgi:DNA-binding Lrp family transcriptional regulator